MAASNGDHKTMISRASMALYFMMSNRSFTIDDLAEYLDLHKKNARRWFTAMSTVFPVIEIRPPRYGVGYGRSAGLYRLDPTWVKNITSRGV